MNYSTVTSQDVTAHLSQVITPPAKGKEISTQLEEHVYPMCMDVSHSACNYARRLFFSKTELI